MISPIPRESEATEGRGRQEILTDLDHVRPIPVREPVNIRIRFATTTRADILQAVPGMRRVDGTTVEYDAVDMTEAYKLIRLMYKYVSW